MRISFKLALTFLTVVFAGFVAQALLSMRWHAVLYRSDAIRDLRTMGRTLAPVVAAVIRTQGEERAAGLVEEANDSIEATRIRWIAASALSEEPLIHARTGGVERVLEGRDVVVGRDDTDPESVHLYQPVTFGGGVQGVIALSEPLIGGPEILSGRLAALSALAGLLAIACGLAAFVVSRRWVERPVRQLMEKARRIGTEDFGRPIELAGHREFSVLAGEMNTMAERLAAARTLIATETAARIAALEQLRHADRLSTIGRLAAGIAHELGTPLNVVSERAEMIAWGEHARPEGVVQSALVIQQQSARMVGIVRHLLDFARRRKPDRCPTQLGELARSSARLVAPLVDGRGVTIRVIEPGAPIWCAVDPSQIEQVITNLLTNAVDVTPRGGDVRVRVETSQAAPPESDPHRTWACISVEDDGPGLPAELVPRIFEPFFTTKPAGQGTGLGLAIAEEIVREHGGSIEVQSTMGRGSRMRVWLPLETVA